MAKLSITAQVILASHFAFGDDSTLTMGNEKSRMTERSRNAMTELIMERIIEASKADDSRAESLIYRLTEKGKRLKRRKSLAWMEKNSRFPFSEPIKKSENEHGL